MFWLRNKKIVETLKIPKYNIGGESPCKDQESMQSSTCTTPDPGRHMGKCKKKHKKKLHTESQAGGHKAAMNRQDSMTDTTPNNKKDPQKKHRLGKVSKIICWRA